MGVVILGLCNVSDTSIAAGFESAIRQISGVKTVSVDFIRQTVRIECENEPPLQLLQSAATRVGVRLKSTKSVVTHVLEARDLENPVVQETLRRELSAQEHVTKYHFSPVTGRIQIQRRLADGFPELVAGLNNAGVYCNTVNTVNEETPNDKSDWLALGGTFLLLIGSIVQLFVTDLYTPSVLILAAATVLTSVPLALDVLKGTFLERRYVATMPVLVAVGACAANAYWLFAALLSTVCFVFRFVERRALWNVCRRLAFLQTLQVDVAREESGQGIRAVTVPELKTNTVIRLSANEILAADGVLACDHAEFRNPFSSGKIEKRIKGQEVLAGFTLLTEHASVSVQRAGDASLLSRAIAALHEAIMQPLRTSSRIKAGVALASFILLLAGCALLLAIEHPDIQLSREWHTRAISLLAIAGFSSIVMASRFVHLSAWAALLERGVLIRHPRFWRQLASLDKILFDKPGVLTMNRPEVHEVIALQGRPVKTVAALAGNLAWHVDAADYKAVSLHAINKGAENISLDNIETRHEQFVSATYKGERYILGNFKVIREMGIATPEVQRKIQLWEREGANVLLLANAQAVIGLITLMDPLRENIGAMVDGLHKQHVESLVVLSDDNQGVANAFAEKMGFDQVCSELSLDDKRAYIREIEAQQAWVAMVSNHPETSDDTRLTRIATACQWSQERIGKNDVVLLDDDLNLIPDTLFIARQLITRTRVLTLAFWLYKFILLATVVAGFLSVWGTVLVEALLSYILLSKSVNGKWREWITPAIRPTSTMRLRPPRKQRIFSPGLIR